jgi:hypothetical protein
VDVQGAHAFIVFVRDARQSRQRSAEHRARARAQSFMSLRTLAERDGDTDEAHGPNVQLALRLRYLGALGAATLRDTCILVQQELEDEFVEDAEVLLQALQAKAFA